MAPILKMFILLSTITMPTFMLLPHFSQFDQTITQICSTAVCNTSSNHSRYYIDSADQTSYRQKRVQRGSRKTCLSEIIKLK